MKQENDKFSGSETKKEFLKPGIKILFTLFAVSMFALALAHAARAEDDSEDNEREYAHNSTVINRTESEHEDDSWDFSDDFEEKESPVVVHNVTNATNVTKAVVPIKKVEKIEVIEEDVEEEIPVEEIPLDEATINDTFDGSWNGALNSTPINITIPEIDLSGYDDNDHDGVVDKYDQYPGENDRLYTDSDNDGVVDARDQYPGKNDLDYNDSDHDGIPDSRDDNRPGELNRSFWIRLLSWLGLFKEAQ